MILAPKLKNCCKILQPWNSKLSVHKHFQPRIKEQKHTRREKRSRRICCWGLLYEQGLEFEASLETRVHANCLWGTFGSVAHGRHWACGRVWFQLILSHKSKIPGQSTHKSEIQGLCTFLCVAYTPELSFFVRHVFVSITTAPFFGPSISCSRVILESSRPLFARLSLCAVFCSIKPSEKLVISIHAPFFERSVFYLRVILKSSRTHYSRVLFCAQRFLFASHSEKLATFIGAPFFERSVFYSRATLKSSQPLFAHLPLCAAFSIREPFWKARDHYSRVFLWALRLFFLGVPNGTYEL